MKRLFLVLCICLQALLSSNAMAWSPLDVYSSVIEPVSQCYSLVAASDENEEKKKNKEVEDEEEPDCD
jgi:transcription elongation factor Elf1